MKIVPSRFSPPLPYPASLDQTLTSTPRCAKEKKEADRGVKELPNLNLYTRCARRSDRAALDMGSKMSFIVSNMSICSFSGGNKLGLPDLALGEGIWKFGTNTSIRKDDNGDFRKCFYKLGVKIYTIQNFGSEESQLAVGHTYIFGSQLPLSRNLYIDLGFEKEEEDTSAHLGSPFN
ncbi:hypothetical protein Tco_0894007 [Tanacetum coccineum]|uniref:Uncharacterized protein n=1 Tax=Tanacetum coccineum TaxID=301880 RepID=A0ABQ5CAG4_9ASTR